MSGAKNLAMVPICRAMVAFPAVPAPTAVIAARIACRVLDSLAHHSGKAKLGFAMRHGLRQTRLRIAATSRVRARNGANLTSGAKDEPRSTKSVINCPAGGEFVDPRQIHRQLTVPRFDRLALARGILELKAREAGRR